MVLTGRLPYPARIIKVDRKNTHTTYTVKKEKTNRKRYRTENK